MYEEPEIPFPDNLVLPEELNLAFDFYDPIDKKTYKIERTFSKLYEADKLNSFLKILTPLNPINKSNKSLNEATPKLANSSNFSLMIKYILFAILRRLYS